MLEQLDIFNARPLPTVAPNELASAGDKARVAPCGNAMKATTAAISSMRAGERVVYHTGRLSVDRLTNAELGGIAAAYSKAEEDGAVILSQRRLAVDLYEYRATKVRR